MASTGTIRMKDGLAYDLHVVKKLTNSMNNLYGLRSVPKISLLVHIVRPFIFMDHEIRNPA